MKKFISVFLTLILAFALLFSFATVAHADGGTTTVQQPDFFAALIDKAADIVQTLVLTAIGIIGAWVSSKLAASTRLKNVGAAWDEAVKAAKLTVGELKQTLADNLKAAHSDGKLTKEEIAALQKKLLEMSIEKMSAPAYDILIAAAVDVNALITGAGEAFIEQIKRGDIAGLLAEGVPLNE
jgi:hypothetical protein